MSENQNNIPVEEELQEQDINILKKIRIRRGYKKIIILNELVLSCTAGFMEL